MGHLQVVILTFGVAIQCAGLFYVCTGLGGGTRSRYYTSKYHKLSYVLYISVVMDCVTVRVLNLTSILSSNGCNFYTDFDFLSFFLL